MEVLDGSLEELAKLIEDDVIDDIEDEFWYKGVIPPDPDIPYLHHEREVMAFCQGCLGMEVVDQIRGYEETEWRTMEQSSVRIVDGKLVHKCGGELRLFI
jgi:hypothetical protein